MRRMRVIPLLAAVLAVLSSTAVTAGTAQAANSTVINLRVTGCDGCEIGVQRGIGADSSVTPAKPRYWNGPSGVVRNGVLKLTVPTAFTPGMSFTIRAPWEGDTNFVANIVLGSGGAPGTAVSPAQARATKKATACWAGTAQKSQTVVVHVQKVRVAGLDGKATAALAWASPTLSTVGELSPTYRGTLGNQEAYYC